MGIVAAVDFSESSAEALREAIRISADHKALLTVVHVIDSRITEDLAERMHIDKAELLRETESLLDRFVRRATLAASADNARQLVVSGHPLEELINVVGARSAGLLVLGGRGSTEDRRGVGTIASNCVRKIPAEVLVVRQAPGDGMFRRIFACVDFSEESKKAVRVAARIARRGGAELNLLHVCRPVVSDYSDRATPHPRRIPSRIAAPPHPEQEFADRQRQRLRDLAAESPGLAVRIHVCTDSHASLRIVEILGAQAADLAVLGARGRTAARFLPMGTTAESIVEHSPCSVLTVRPGGFPFEA